MAIAFLSAIKILFFLAGISLRQQNQQAITDNNNVITSPPTSISKYPDGKVLFSQNCAACHAVNKTLTGPALAGVSERIPDKKLLYEWIRDNEKVLKSKSSYFVQLYNDFNKTPMNKFPNLTDENIDAILNYIGEEARKPVSTPVSGSVVASLVQY